MNVRLPYISTVDHNSDLIGAIASVLCVIHCLITPFLFAAQSTVSHVCSEISPFWWKIMDIAFLVITFFAVYFTSRSTTLRWISTALYVLWAVMTVLVINKFFHLVPVPSALVYIPAISLSVLHLYNRKHCACAEDACCIS